MSNNYLPRKEEESLFIDLAALKRHKSKHLIQQLNSVL